MKAPQHWPGRQYNVVFHQAWRFQAQAEETDPWILIKAGQSLEGRYQIEGALRFYKSRFLHFEPNLWLLEFANDNSQLIELPDFPIKLDAVDSISEGDAEFPAPQDPGLVVIESSELRVKPAPEYGVTEGPEALLIEDNLTSLLVTEQAQPKQYPVSAVWVFNRSKRIDENEIYYLDHPQMGAIVTIKAYQPELLNPPVTPAEPQLEEPLLGD